MNPLIQVGEKLPGNNNIGRIIVFVILVVKSETHQIDGSHKFNVKAKNFNFSENFVKFPNFSLTFL